jgi:hypothetical protein
MHSRSITISGSILSIFLASACTTDTVDPEPAPVETATLALTLDGVEPIGDGYELEGWIIVDDAPISTGRFNVSEEGEIHQFEVSAQDAEQATAFVLTIEPTDDPDPGPSDVHLLGGSLSGGGADLTIDHPAALGTDFANAWARYICQTPTTMDVAEDFDQGVWFLDPSSGEMLPGMSLPELPEGWVYEGWVASADGPVSLGRFSGAEGADEDGAGPYAGPDAYPAFPGQDFIDPAMVLENGDFAVVISVEPSPDDSAAPFAIKPLVDPVLENVGAGTPQNLENMHENNPTGVVTIQ